MSSKKILIINGHPDKESFNFCLAAAYRKGAERAAQAQIKWAEHLIWVYLVWWGSVSAIMKGILDRTFLPDFAFKKKQDLYGGINI